MGTETRLPEPLARWLEGKRTYLTAGGILVCGILAAFGVQIPEYVWAALAAAGLGFLRAGVKRAE